MANFVRETYEVVECSSLGVIVGHGWGDDVLTVYTPGIPGYEFWKAEALRRESVRKKLAAEA